MDPETLERAKDLAARHLGRRMRSEKEMETYLRKKGFDADLAARVIGDFCRVGLLNDRALVRDWAERRLESHPSGRRALEQKLAARGVSRDVITEVLDEMLPPGIERELGHRAAAGYLQRVRTLSPETRGPRLYRFLVQRGFSHDTATELVEEMEP